MIDGDMTTHYLVLSALGPDRPGLVAELSSFLAERGGNVEDSRMAVLGGEFGMMALVSGTEAEIARIERELPTLEPKTGAKIVTRRTRSPEEHRQGESLPVVIEAESFDREGIVRAIASALHGLGVNIVSLETAQWNAPFTGAELFRIQVRADVPREVGLPRLRATLNEVGVREHLDLDVRAAS
jgi:glycine cleavage system transcriptional repressor